MRLTLRELLDGVPSPAFVGCGPETRVEGVAVDSRAVAPEHAFIATTGATHDGHRFLDAARTAGASVALIEKGRCEAPNWPHVWLADTGAALATLAANAHGRPASTLALAGITGTNGKTTTTHLVGAMLRSAGRPHARLGTTGNWLVDREETAAFTTPPPLALQALLGRARDRGAQEVVMEVSSHALAQGRVDTLAFRAVGLTSFSQDHLDFHPDMDAYFAAKRRLPAEYLAEDGVAVAVMESTDRAASFLAAAADTGRIAWRASRDGSAGADLRITRAEPDPTGVQLRIETPAGAFETRSPLLGRFNLDNILVATGIGLALGLAADQIGDALATTRGAPGRLEPVTAPGVSGPMVVVDYAHTPDAVERVIEALRPLCRGRLVTVLGCGGDRDAAKRPMMGEIAARGSDRFYATSDNPRTEDPDRIVDMMVAGVPADRRSHTIREVDRAAAIARAVAEADPGDLVLIAGKGHEDYQILGTERIHFDDREHARSALLAR